MNTMILTEEQKKLVEKTGLMHESEGFPPAVSRVMALLIVCDRIELTFDEIRETLNLSKSATSNAINLAMKLDRITYLTRCGERKRYFRSNIAQWQDKVMKDYRKKMQTAILLREIIKQRPADTIEFNQSISRLASFIEYMVAELPRLYEQWEKQSAR